MGATWNSSIELFYTGESQPKASWDSGQTGSQWCDAQCSSSFKCLKLWPLVWKCHPYNKFTHKMDVCSNLFVCIVKIDGISQHIHTSITQAFPLFFALSISSIKLFMLTSNINYLVILSHNLFQEECGCSDGYFLSFSVFFSSFTTTVNFQTHICLIDQAY